MCHRETSPDLGETRTRGLLCTERPEPQELRANRAGGRRKPTATLTPSRRAAGTRSAAPARPPASALAVCTADQLPSDPACTARRALCCGRRLVGKGESKTSARKVATVNPSLLCQPQNISRVPKGNENRGVWSERGVTARRPKQIHTTPGWFCGIFNPGGNAHWKCYTSSSAKKKCAKTQTKAKPNPPAPAKPQFHPDSRIHKRKRCHRPTLGRVLACPLCFFSWVEAVEVFMLNMGSRRVEPR